MSMDKPKKDSASIGTATKKKRSTPSRRVFPFMKLPAEIRLKIFGLCLVSEDLMSLYETYGSLMSKRTGQLKPELGNLSKANRRRRLKTYHRNPVKYYRNGPLNEMAVQILQLNHQIYNEALPVLYNQPLEFYTTEALDLFFACTNTAMPPMLRNITIRRTHLSQDTPQQLSYNQAYLRFDKLSLAVNIQKFSINQLIVSDYDFIDEQSTAKGAELFIEVAQHWLAMIRNREKGETNWKKVVHVESFLCCERYCICRLSPVCPVPPREPVDFMATLEKHLAVRGL
ncbi:hypothetical protein FKW77_005579 [Venturia effusa]|uniref:F-box domain-containing protein n=1 Tax=Venturia effusa TaxID=50376 RepID=A0A517LK94_9PEZI|nr:hypothetical protein FKW77_005579 [Venturia effusa]